MHTHTYIHSFIHTYIHTYISGFCWLHGVCRARSHAVPKPKKKAVSARRLGRRKKGQGVSQFAIVANSCPPQPSQRGPVSTGADLSSVERTNKT